MDFVKQIAEKVMDFVVGQAGEELGYLFKYQSHIDNLELEAAKLETARKVVQEKMKAAEDNLQVVEPVVLIWAKHVDALTNDAGKILKANDEPKANTRCLDGCCINLWSRYKFGKEAYQKTSEIIKYQVPNFERFSHPAPLSEIESSSSATLFSGLHSRNSTMKDIMKALDDKSVNVIGICGMGGIGKTTIVKEVCRQAKASKLFDEIAMVVMSKTVSVTKIQEGIADKLCMKFDNLDEPKRAQKLWLRIKTEQKILIILDDVWEYLDLTEVGIPFGEDHMGCKIVLTSRNKSVCDDMMCEKIFPIAVLSEQEAWVLFKRMVGKAVDSYDLNPIAIEVASKCSGLPIAIVTVGRALRNRDKHQWKLAAKQLETPFQDKIKGMDMDGKVYTPLEFSYNSLESEAEKSFFLLCSLFPEDYLIPVEVLVKYIVGHKLIPGAGTIEKARVETNALVSNLVSSFMLEEKDVNRIRYVKMHDIVREVAIVIASKEENKKYMVKAGVGLRDWPDNSNDDSSPNYTAISLMENDICELPDGLEYPKLQALLLQGKSYKFNRFALGALLLQGRSYKFNKFELKIPSNFFQGMKDVKVLDISHHKIWSLPPSISLLTTLLTLCLDNCDLGDISVIGTLKQLEILSLSGSYITEIPSHFTQLTSLRLFDLRCGLLRKISPGVISSLRKLEELYIGTCFSDWAVLKEGEENSRSNASLDELKSLTRLTTLYVYVPNADMLPHELKFQNLTRFAISIGNADTVPQSHEKTLSLTYDSGLSEPVKVLLKRTEVLLLKECKSLKNVLNDLNNGGFDKLKRLKLHSCNAMKYLLDTVDWVAPRMAFSNLEELTLDRMNKFSEICHGPLPAMSFSKVRRLEVSNCSSISNVVPPNLLIRLQCLENVEADHCPSLQNVFDLEGLVPEREDTKLLSRLQHLALYDLPELMHIWKAPHHFVNLCKLGSVSVEGCEKLRQLFPPSQVQGLIHLKSIGVRYCSSMEEIFGMHEEERMEIVVLEKSRITSTSLQNLTRVHVSNCDRLRNIFSYSIAKGLVQLEVLTILDCAMVEAVVDEKGEATTSIEKIVFPHLYMIQLGNLDSLTCCWRDAYAVEYPSLEEVKITRCPKLKIFGHGVQMTPKLNKVLVNDIWRSKYEEIWMGDLNSTVRELFKQKAKPPEQGAESPPL